MSYCDRYQAVICALFISIDRFKRINEAEGDVAAFNQVFEQYSKAPEVTRARIYLETLGDVLPQARQQIIVDDTVQQIMPMLPLNSKLLEAAP